MTTSCRETVKPQMLAEISCFSYFLKTLFILQQSADMLQVGVAPFSSI